ncbi:GYD domain-containing protein [Sulfitobacter mediterraneus]|uniref:GYD domain-containing protein n=1 Tax=Sulfitobacter mediterraneus TaxID=83219 RepID=UPI001931190C|nr:GYD domain-containing protein [Sulfitobacter mediterraneus]MBM1642735.1 GYD domain-containing protein [Sulfitobacter mediterraneus]MBM1646783.1 GYD domain-containing protein [Sulfitobacter mediterraneus]MBM1650889.1 GYD domain-containing protein [Sulfitobacter mediterraneus]MBM1654851.1 GYD domain-containing protein [Sulfitobacter mediterraneus]
MVEGDTDREDVARAVCEAAGGKLIGFYGLLGQEHHVALIADMPSVSEYVGTVLAATMGGAIESFKTIPMYSSAESHKARDVYKQVKGTYAPPTN